MPDEGTPETLRQRLIDKISERWFIDAENATDAALAVFRDWLREKAAVHSIIREGDKSVIYAGLADAIDKELNTDGR